MGNKITFILIVFLASMSIFISGCWSTPNDYWQDVDTSTSSSTDTETQVPDAGECFETDDCSDAGS